MGISFLRKKFGVIFEDDWVRVQKFFSWWFAAIDFCAKRGFSLTL